LICYQDTPLMIAYKKYQLECSPANAAVYNFDSIVKFVGC
jgi:hypothetical protein